MKLPNGYGGVVKLPGKRRKPWGVRISILEEVDGIQRRKRKYLEYFATQKEALAYLADYNKGLAVHEHTSISDMLTFKELFDKWIEWRWSFKSHPGDAALTSYKAAFKKYSSLHSRKIATLHTADLQECLNSCNGMSSSTITNMGIVVRGMWKYALSCELVDHDITTGLVLESTEAKQKHTRFSDEEISKLWASLGKIPNVDLVLILIYTGLRITEFLTMECSNINIVDHYMVGGVKTEAGRNRIIPIHDAILPLIHTRMGGRYLIPRSGGQKYTTNGFRIGIWDNLCKQLGMEHIPHDTRYTFAALANNAGLNDVCLKIILGHSLSNASGSAFKIGGSGDVTKNVYTEKTIPELVAEVNKIPVVTHL